jgi:RNA polymerase primary sigma factor
MTETPDPDQIADEAIASDGFHVIDTDAVEQHAAEAQQVEAPSFGSGATEDDDMAAVVAQVKERGFITTGEIFAAFPDLEPDADELRELWEMFESRGIKVLDEIAEELKLEDQRRAGSPPVPPAPVAEPPRPRVEHRPSGATRPASQSPAKRGGGASYDEPDEELQAVRAAQRPTHTEGGSFDPVRMYLKEIGKVPLLTAEQEVTLAKRIEAGLQAQEKMEPVNEEGEPLPVDLSDSQRSSMFAVQRDGQLARRQLTEANLRLVVSIA